MLLLSCAALGSTVIENSRGKARSFSPTGGIQFYFAVSAVVGVKIVAAGFDLDVGIIALHGGQTIEEGIDVDLTRCQLVDQVVVNRRSASCV